MSKWKESEDKREEIRDLKREFYKLVYPNRNYMVYFETYFPEQVSSDKDKFRIRNTWRETTLHDDIIDMMKVIIKKEKEKQKRK